MGAAFLGWIFFVCVCINNKEGSIAVKNKLILPVDFYWISSLLMKKRSALTQGKSEDSLVYQTCPKQNQLQQVAQGHVQSGFEKSQG